MVTMAKTSDKECYFLLHPPLPFPLPALCSFLEQDRELEGDEVTAADTYPGILAHRYPGDWSHGRAVTTFFGELLLLFLEERVLFPQS